MTDDLKLGDGNHKIVYAHPTDKNLCVKILLTTPDSDFDKEMRYRQALGKKADAMTLLTKYFGEVNTNKGKGYLFERVIDFDGNVSKTVFDHIQNPISTDDLISLLLDFKHKFINEKFVAAGMDPVNFMVQRISEAERQVKIIDNIGTSAKFPIEFLMAKRARKYWKRFVKEISIEHSGIITKDLVKILLDN